jgi:hypothetical protein
MKSKKSKIKKNTTKPELSKEFNINLKCSPNSPENQRHDYTCYSDDSLLKIRNFWNARHPDRRIDTEEPRDIWGQLKNNMKNVCDAESCWLRQNFIKEKLDKELLQFTFAPKSPNSWKANEYEWLSSVDITDVMRQYEHAYPSFQFIGPSPIDFDSLKIYGQCVWEELCKFELYDYIHKGKTKIGIVFNTDPHYKEGSHWIALFINVSKKYIYYFDSNGNPPPNEVKKFSERVKSQGNSLGIDLNVTSNYPRSHQKTDSECGMYVLYFIIKLLTGNVKDPALFGKQLIPDEEVHKMRNEYFNPNL